MECPYCQSSTTTERPENTARGYRRFRCRTCIRGFNERTGSIFNRVHYPPAVVCLVVLWRVRYKLSLVELSEMFLERWVSFSHEAVREWETNRTNRYLNNHLEQDHHRIKQRTHPMGGCKSFVSAARFCRVYDEIPISSAHALDEMK